MSRSTLKQLVVRLKTHTIFSNRDRLNTRFDRHDGTVGRPSLFRIVTSQLCAFRRFLQCNAFETRQPIPQQ